MNSILWRELCLNSDFRLALCADFVLKARKAASRPGLAAGGSLAAS
jgi:hypothetical protein